MSFERITTLTKKLIEFRTVRPREDFVAQINSCMDVVCESFDTSILLDRAEKYVVDDSCPITIATYYNTKEPELLLIGHIDVVAGDDAQFHPCEQDGRIYGRGAKDMKAGVAAMIEIMNHYAQHDVKPNIAAAIVSDEEDGGLRGAHVIVEKMGYRPKFVIGPDPGECHGIVHKEKGLLWTLITAVGKSSHASRPWLGDCAYTKAFRMCQELLHEFNVAQSEVDWRTTASVTQLDKVIRNSAETRGSLFDPSNAIAEMVRFRVDLRYTENDNVESIQARIRQIVHRHGSEHIVDFENIGTVSYTPHDHHTVQRFKAAAESVEDADIPIIASAGASDLRYFSEKNIPCVTYGQQGANHHGKGEYVDIKSIETFCQVVTRYIDEYGVE